ncbi:MAG TPA: hypothetical protein VJZ00_16165, partial [Thermoanaerobaculia bacterium]|nr:hypothetical protein [Thermoanaerobaculia bacterium]
QQLVGNLDVRRVTRVFERGALIQTDDAETAFEPIESVFNASDAAVVSSGMLWGVAAKQDIRFVHTETEAWLINDVYVSWQPDDVFVGRARAVSLDQPLPRSDLTTLATAPPAPAVTSIAGVFTDSSIGIVKGIVSMGTCGGSWDGAMAINNEPGPYTWLVNGRNFGTQRGTVVVGGVSAQIIAWSATQIHINPTIYYRAAPMTAVVSVKLPTGTSTTSAIGVAPAIKTRVYGQCTWYVARTRIDMGKQPSPGAYTGYSPITATYVPAVGDQLHWLSRHTAIITAVGAPKTQGETTTWSVTVEEYNADCKNGFNRYTTSFIIRTVKGQKTLVQSVLSSIASFKTATTYYYR